MILFSFDNDDTNVSKGPATPIYNAEDGANRFLHNPDI
jgi:hypothetical protein